MILSRYLARDILQTTAAVSLVLLLIFLSGRFAKFLVDAATGNISADIILGLLLYRAPNMLERILPLSLFLSILLVFGRLYVENEISALHAAGVSLPRLLRSSMLAILPIAALVGWLTLYVSPAAFQRSEQMLNDEKKRSELDLLEAGKFLQLRNGEGVVYTGEIGEGRRTMRDVFIASQNGQGNWEVIRAQDGLQQYDENLDSRFLTLNNGLRYILLPGQARAERLRFSSMIQRIQPIDDYDTRRFQEDTLSMRELLDDPENPSRQATLQWRLSLILLVPIVSLLAVAMSRTNPRRGRYIKLLPAMLIYFTYMGILDVLRHKLTDGSIPAMPGMLVAHACLLVIGLLLLYSDKVPLLRRVM
ncbi:MAG TPA: LPS export ABC transporter permease LptF [Pseudomonadales bacterium]|nr:LPS export ABC transporter permease LptF [Pseudomonadales bacterium]